MIYYLMIAAVWYITFFIVNTFLTVIDRKVGHVEPLYYVFNTVFVPTAVAFLFSQIW